MQSLRSVHNAEKRTALVEVVRAIGAPGLRLLDIGCGPASDIHKHARLGIGHVVGLDNDAAVIDEARKRATQYPGEDFRFEVCVDVLDYLQRLPDRSVDIATCHFSVHFFVDRLAELCTQLRRVVRPRGVWVVATINASSVPDNFLGEHLQVTKSECRSRMRYRLDHTRYFGETCSEEPTLTTADLVREATTAGWFLGRCHTFGSGGLPRDYTPELAMITGFHEWLHFV